jgi:hypothetical protein
VRECRYGTATFPGQYLTPPHLSGGAPHRTSCTFRRKLAATASAAPERPSSTRRKSSKNAPFSVFDAGPESGPKFAQGRHRKVVSLAQRIIEMLIGRLISDEQFREEFLRDPERTLLALCDRGLELSRTEIAALISTDPTLWGRAAAALDPRLQKVSLTTESRAS